MNTLAVRLALVTSALAAGPAATARADLLLHYDFNDGAGTTAADSGAAPAAPGTLNGGAGWTTNTPGGTGAALDSFDPDAASVRFVTVGDADKLDGLSQFTLSIWVNFQAAPAGNRRLFSKQASSALFEGFTWNISDAANTDGRSASNFGTRLFVGGANGFFFDAVPSAATTPDMVFDADNKWAFLAVSYDGAAAVDNVHYYYGTPTTPVTLAATTTIPAGATLPSAAIAGIGYTDAAPGANTSLPGFVDDARVYDTVLTQSDLDLVRQANAAPPHLTGDTNNDGVVDLNDLNNVLNNFGGPGPNNPGDENHDNTVDLNDLNNVLNNFGAHAAASALSVPEPASLLLLTTGYWLLATSRPRRRA